MPNYRGSKGGAYNTTYSGATPVELFDAGRYGECLHACMFLLYALNDERRALDELNDEGLLHELAHLSTGVPIGLNNSQQTIRDELSQLWDDFNSLVRASA